MCSFFEKHILGHIWSSVPDTWTHPFPHPTCVETYFPQPHERIFSYWNSCFGKTCLPSPKLLKIIPGVAHLGGGHVLNKKTVVAYQTLEISTSHKNNAWIIRWFFSLQICRCVISRCNSLLLDFHGNLKNEPIRDLPNISVCRVERSSIVTKLWDSRSNVLVLFVRPYGVSF